MLVVIDYFGCVSRQIEDVVGSEDIRNDDGGLLLVAEVY